VGDQQVIYEQPLNERMRMALRLEYLLRRAHANLPVPSPWAARTVLDSLLQLQELLGRVDVRQDMLKTLERHQHSLERMRQSPKADGARVDAVLKDVRQAVDGLQADSGAVGHELKRLDMLNGLKHSAMVPGGAGGFEHPYLHHWLTRDAAKRERDLQTWVGYFAALERVVSLVLWLTRHSADPETQIAKSGFFNQTLSRGADFQLARVTLPAGSPWFANISANPLRITIRFMAPAEDMDRAIQTKEAVEFQLTLCPGNQQHVHRHA